MFGMDMRTGAERGQAERASLAEGMAPLDKAMAEYGIQAKYAEDDRTRAMAMQGMMQAQEAIRVRDERDLANQQDDVARTTMYDTFINNGQTVDAELLKSRGISMAVAAQRQQAFETTKTMAANGLSGQSAALKAAGLVDSPLYTRVQDKEFKDLDPTSFARMVGRAKDTKELTSIAESGRDDVKPYVDEIESGLIRTVGELQTRMKEDRARTASGQAARRLKGMSYHRLADGKIVQGGLAGIGPNGDDAPAYYKEGVLTRMPEGAEKLPTRLATKGLRESVASSLDSVLGRKYTTLPAGEQQQVLDKIVYETQIAVLRGEDPSDAAQQLAMKIEDSFTSKGSTIPFVDWFTTGYDTWELTKEAPAKEKQTPSGPAIGTIATDDAGNRVEFTGGDQYDKSNWRVVE
jgi:hypothetical protein